MTGTARPTCARPWSRPCPRCWRAARPMRFTPGDYAELLAHYLGDGTISSGARSFRLRIALDAKYPGIIDDARALLERCFPRNPTGLVQAHGGTMYFVSLYSTHLPCLFPQHGPGLKHQRKIRARDVAMEPDRVGPRGASSAAASASDGCCFVNRTGPYEYLSYDFSNMSEDIADSSPQPAITSASSTRAATAAARHVARADQPSCKRGANARARGAQGVSDR